MKQFGFVNDSAENEYKSLPKEISQAFGASLNQVQHDKKPFLPVKHLSGWVGVIELIINGSPAYRCVYTTKFDDTVMVLHSFTKTTNGVDRKAMSTVDIRYKELTRMQTRK